MLLHQVRPVLPGNGLAPVGGMAPLAKARVGIVQARQRAQQGGFAAAHGPHERRHHMGLQGKVKLCQHHLLAKGGAQAVNVQAGRGVRRKGGGQGRHAKVLRVCCGRSPKRMA